MALGYGHQHQHLPQPPQQTPTMIDLSPRTSSTSTSTSTCKRSSRIEKPRSSHNSPKALQHRRRTTSSVKKYVGLDDHWEMMFGQQDASSFSSSNRPVSWHPTSSYYPDSYLSSPADDVCSQTGSYGFPDQTSPYPSSSAVAYVSALAERKRNYPPSSIGSPDVSMDPTPFPVWQDPCTPDSTFAMTSFPPMASQQDWTSMAATAAATAQPTSHPRLDSNSSSDFSSMQADDNASDYMADDDDDAREPETVLVGMGLYDPPSYESMLTSGLGKGLKLEETWQPPAEKDDDDDDEEEEEEEDEEPEEVDDDTDDNASSESESSVEEPPAPATVDRWSALHPAQAATAAVMPADMAGQGFVLENLDAGETAYASEWWYHAQHQQQHQQAAKQQPTMMGLGYSYGWLPHHHRAQC